MIEHRAIQIDFNVWPIVCLHCSIACSGCCDSGLINRGVRVNDIAM